MPQHFGVVTWSCLRCLTHRGGKLTHWGLDQSTPIRATTWYDHVMHDMTCHDHVMQVPPNYYTPTLYFTPKAFKVTICNRIQPDIWIQCILDLRKKGVQRPVWNRISSSRAISNFCWSHISCHTDKNRYYTWSYSPPSCPSTSIDQSVKQD